MKLLGLNLTRKRLDVTASAVSGDGWWPIIKESFTGAWQQNVEVRQETVLAFSTVYACITLIAADIGKLPLRLMEIDSDGIWNEVSVPAFSPVLKKPNSYQNRIKFVEKWITSKLSHGAAYVLKVYDNRNVVTSMHVLDPRRVTPLVTPFGDVYYRLARDNLADIEEEIVVPASAIIHDRMVCLFHPLIGNSPIFACGLAAMQGTAIQNNSTNFFQSGSKPGGVLTAPGAISDATAKRLSDYWNTSFNGANAGKTAVLGDGLTYQQMVMTAVDAQLIDQLKWSSENVAACFHVPGYMVGAGVQPTHENIEALNQWYYNQCLQSLIENLELCINEGLSLPDGYSAQVDLKALLRMDTAARINANAEAIKAGMLKPNEARKDENLSPVEGGDTPYLQQQNYSLAALAKRDEAGIFVTDKPATAPTPDAGAGSPPNDNPANAPATNSSAKDMVLAIITKFQKETYAA